MSITTVSKELIASVCNEDVGPEKVRSCTLSGRGLASISTDISECVHLERLDLSNNVLKNVKGIGSCQALRWLSVAHNQLQELKGALQSRTLHVLNASHNKLTEVKRLGKLQELKALILNNNSLSVFSPSTECPELNTLVLSHNQLEAVDASPFENLTKLSLSNNKLSQCPVVKRNRKLKELRLAHNKISNIDESISRCKKLMVIDLGNNEINDFKCLAPLSSIPYLLNVNLKGNPVCQLADYELKVREMIPSIQILDGKKLEKAIPSVSQKSDNQFDKVAKEKAKGNSNGKLKLSNSPRKSKQIAKGGFKKKHDIKPEVTELIIAKTDPDQSVTPEGVVENENNDTKKRVKKRKVQLPRDIVDVAEGAVTADSHAKKKKKGRLDTDKQLARHDDKKSDTKDKEGSSGAALNEKKKLKNKRDTSKPSQRSGVVSVKKSRNRGKPDTPFDPQHLANTAAIGEGRDFQW